MTSESFRQNDTLSPSAYKVLDALAGETLCEHDLYVRLRPISRMGLHRALADLRDRRLIEVRELGRLPGPVLTMYRLPA